MRDGISNRDVVAVGNTDNGSNVFNDNVSVDELLWRN